MNTVFGFGSSRDFSKALALVRSKLPQGYIKIPRVPCRWSRCSSKPGRAYLVDHDFFRWFAALCRFLSPSASASALPPAAASSSSEARTNASVIGMTILVEPLRHIDRRRALLHPYASHNKDLPGCSANALPIPSAVHQNRVYAHALPSSCRQLSVCH